MDYDNKSLSAFLEGKSTQTAELVDHFILCYKQIGDVKFHTTKTTIAFSSHINFAYIIQFGKNFIDIVLPFRQTFPDNLCFRKIKPVPGSNEYNHHLRIYYKEDINEEVLMYMEMAYKNGC